MFVIQLGVPMSADANWIASQLVAALMQAKQRLVLAESCTCGAAAAAIGTVPGASQVFCGSAVTYREATKQKWLGIDHKLIHRNTAESQVVTNEMATAALQRTPESAIAVAITGHLGPDAPEAIDGVIFVAVASHDQPIIEASLRLQSLSRMERQSEAAAVMLRVALDSLA